VHKMVRRIAKATLEAMSADAINVGQNNGICANQRVMHYHVHVIPRWCSHPLNWERTEVSYQRLQEIANKIKVVYEKYYGNESENTKL
ncbi:MAG: HIT family protein, partial [Thermoplasmata archaeon]